ncbi:hypothetical protein [Kitasatospora purpeofusca]|uniref:hypothetical protein n=1 Tax=Kitasatospora purpeofusca TaxID=67352 RepID=UPI003657E7A4
MIDPASIDLAEFLTTWYGPPSQSSAVLPKEVDWLPAPLKEWHILTSRRDKPVTYMTTLLSPEDIQVEDDGKAVFMVDSTDDWHWSFDPSDPDTVYEAALHEPWGRNPESTAQLLVHNAVREVMFGATNKIWTFSVPDETLSKILSPLDRIGFESWHWLAPDYQILTGDCIVATVGRSVPGRPGWDVEIASFEASALSGFDGIANVDWRRRSA